MLQPTLKPSPIAHSPTYTDHQASLVIVKETPPSKGEAKRRAGAGGAPRPDEKSVMAPST